MRLEWSTAGQRLEALEPTLEDVRACADELAEAYNDPHNRSMMGHERMTAEDVVQFYADTNAAGARSFLFYADGVLVGDGDLRGIEGDHAELALMIGGRALQGKGLGTRFSLMLHAVAFRALGLERVVVGILPHNAASRRMFEKLGYREDDSPLARDYADDDTDIMMSIDRASFEALHAAALDQVRIVEL